MRFVRAWLIRLAGVFGGARADREFDAELDSHLQLHIDDNLRAGMTPAEARRRALAKLGSVASVSEAHRDFPLVPDQTGKYVNVIQAHGRVLTGAHCRSAQEPVRATLLQVWE